MKVLVSSDIPDNGIRLMRDEGIKVTSWTADRLMSQNEMIDQARDHDALLCIGSDRIDSHFLNECKHLKIISLFSVGYDNIDVAEARRLGIPVSHTPGAMSDATADIAFALLLAVVRKVCYLNKSISKGEWKHFRPKAHLGMELKNKTLGVFGLGRIGMEMARRCKGAYDMQIIYNNRNKNVQAEKLMEARYVSFRELVRKSDILTVHCQLNDETRGKFDREVFRQMKNTSVFINTARGAIHNEKDLINALENGEIWGAGLDVTDPEPMNTDNPLLSMENVAITPHIGSATIEARSEMARMAAMNIIQFFRGNIIPHEI